MKEYGLFDAIGPCMVGPSSSHTAGACRMARMARALFGAQPARVTFTLYGSFAETYLGHGSDKALAGGALGFEPDDLRIRDAPALAREAGMTCEFCPDVRTQTAHPNTVDICMEGDGRSLCVRGVSTGGGGIKIVGIDGVEVNFTGEFPTLVLHHNNVSGVISWFTGEALSGAGAIEKCCVCGKKHGALTLALVGKRQRERSARRSLPGRAACVGLNTLPPAAAGE